MWTEILGSLLYNIVAGGAVAVVEL